MSDGFGNANFRGQAGKAVMFEVFDIIADTSFVYFLCQKDNTMMNVSVMISKGSRVADPGVLPDRYCHGTTEFEEQNAGEKNRNGQRVRIRGQAERKALGAVLCGMYKTALAAEEI